MYAVLEKPPDLEQYDKAGERGKKKMEEQKQLHEDMAKDSNVKELSLRDVKRQCAAAYAKMGLKTSLDTLDLAKFREALKFLGCYLTDSRIIKLFRTADLDGGGDIDCGEFEVAYHVNSMLKTSYIIKPLDAFETFDKEHRGEIDEIEFCELMHALGVNRDSEELQNIFRRHDADQSGSLDFIEFKDLWLHECNFADELTKREGQANNDQE